MTRVVRCGGRRRAGILWLAALWLIPIEVTLLPTFGPIRPAAAQDPGGQAPGGVVPDDGEAMPRPTRGRSRSTRKRTRLADRNPQKKAETRGKAAAKNKSAASEANRPADAGGIKFSQDIAPILVANCNGCHSKNGVGLRRGKLDLSTFEGLQKGAGDHKVLIPGKPEESHLVLRINGEEEPKMPQGGNRALSQDAIARITQWVKEGGRLDAGIDPKASMDSYAATPEQLRRRQLAQMPAQERDKKVIDVGQERWKQSNAKQKAEVTPSKSFILFSNLPSERAASTLKTLEAQANRLKLLLGAKAMDWPEKVSFYVFNNRNEFVEFVRTVEGREVDGEESMSTRFNVPEPYVAAVDPAGGKKEEPAAPSRKRSRSKKAEEPEAAGAERSLAGLLTEGVASGAVASAGNAPRWLREGISTYMAHFAEPRSPYYSHFRRTALESAQQGWETKASQALGGSDQLTADEQRAISFALVESLMTTQLREGFPTFVRGMLKDGQAALDDMLKNVFGYTREQFLNDTAAWVGANYGRGR